MLSTFLTRAARAAGGPAAARALLLVIVGAVAISASIAPALAGETINYTYDVLGRLTKVGHSGTVNNGTSSCYKYDPADNRTNVTVNTAADCAGPAAAVTFSINDVSVKEGGNLIFTVTRSGTPTGTVGVSYATMDGTATAGSDYTAKSAPLTFLSTDPATKTFSVATTDDSAVETNETVLVNLTNPTGGAAIADGQGVGTVQDNETDCVGISFTIASNGAVSEGANAAFTVTKAGSTAFSCSVDYASANSTAVAPGDYTAQSATLTFTSAQATRTISVPTANDAIYESSESFAMNLSAPDKGATLGTPSLATATINDNDACNGVTFTVTSNSAVTEGATSVFTVAKAGTAAGTCNVDYATANTTAVAPADYTSASGTLSFTSSQTAKTVSVTTINDAAAESAETFKLNLSNPTQGAVLGTPATASATINDNDSGGLCSGVSFSVNDASVIEGSPLVFTVSKAGSTTSSCTIGYTTADGTAVAPTQYTATSGTLTFSASQLSQNVSVTTIDTHRVKGTRTMYLNLTSAGAGGSISDGQGVGSIDPSEAGGCTTCLQSTDGSAEELTTDGTQPAVPEGSPDPDPGDAVTAASGSSQGSER